MKIHTFPILPLVTAAILAGCSSSDPLGTHSSASPHAVHANAPANRVLQDAKGVAANGYDVVTYHSEHRAQPGSAQYTASHDGAAYRFASARNRRQFQANPTSYAPAFGGYCAFGVAANGFLVPTNSKTFRIQDGRLLLFFNDQYQGKPMDTSKMWDADTTKLLGQADEKWPTAVPMPQ